MFEGMTVDGVNRPEGQRLDWISLRVARPDFSPDGTRVVYGRDPEEKSYSKVIESSKLDGSDRKRLFDEDKLYAYSPAWSPDGARIAFVWYTGIYTMAADGSDVRLIVPLTEPGYYWNEYDLPYAGPVWSPDGKALAYVVWEPAPDIPPPVENPRRYSLYVAAADGSGSARVFAATGHGTIELDSIGWPSWSPDGERLAFMRHVRGDYDSGRYSVGEEIDAPWGFTLYTIRRDGSELREVAPGVPQVGWNSNAVLFPNASWSPDGTEILFALGDGYIYVAHADGVGYRQVGEGSYASWSPDGSRLAVANPLGAPETYFLDDGGIRTIVPSSDERVTKIGPRSDEGVTRVARTVPSGARVPGTVSTYGFRLGGTERFRDPATSWTHDYLWTVAPDGSDRRVLVRRDEEGALVAANPAPPKPWYRFW